MDSMNHSMIFDQLIIAKHSTPPLFRDTLDTEGRSRATHATRLRCGCYHRASLKTVTGPNRTLHWMWADERRHQPLDPRLGGGQKQSTENTDASYDACGLDINYDCHQMSQVPSDAINPLKTEQWIHESGHCAQKSCMRMKISHPQCWCWASNCPSLYK